MSELDVKQQTADSFAYEWERFGALRDQWRKNFADYMQPHTPESFAGRLVLDVGAGSGRHAFRAAEQGAQVVAVDLGRSIDVARANLPRKVMTVQADAEQLPFALKSFHREHGQKVDGQAFPPRAPRAVRAVGGITRRDGRLALSCIAPDVKAG